MPRNRRYCSSSSSGVVAASRSCASGSSLASFGAAEHRHQVLFLLCARFQKRTRLLHSPFAKGGTQAPPAGRQSLGPPGHRPCPSRTRLRNFVDHRGRQSRDVGAAAAASMRMRSHHRPAPAAAPTLCWFSMSCAPGTRTAIPVPFSDWRLRPLPPRPKSGRCRARLPLAFARALPLPRSVSRDRNRSPHCPD